MLAARLAREITTGKPLTNGEAQNIADRFMADIETLGWRRASRRERAVDGLPVWGLRQAGQEIAFRFQGGARVKVAADVPPGMEAVYLARSVVDLTDALNTTCAELQSLQDQHEAAQTDIAQLREQCARLQEQCATRVKRVERNEKGQITRVVRARIGA